MNKNDAATQHLLTETEAMFFRNNYKLIIDKINSILEEQNLHGTWVISEDFKWLVKTGD